MVCLAPETDLDTFVHLIVQVKTLQLERDQRQMMLLSVQQQHKQEIELIENTHK